MENKVVKLEKLNKQLNPIPKDLPGRFFPGGFSEQFHFMFLALRPSMNVPENWDGANNYNFDAGTNSDDFFKKMLIDCGVAGSYVTDIVKKRALPDQKPNTNEIKEYLPFLLKEIEIIKPKAIILIGKKTWEIFQQYISHHIPIEVKTDWVWHYSQQGAKNNAEVVNRFQDVIDRLK